jgi:hypothetical protein
MSYRIYLTVCKKKDWIDYLGLYNNKEINKDGDVSMYIPEIINMKQCEIYNGIQIDMFNELELNDECNPYILVKSDLLNIIKSYSKLIIDYTEKNIKEIKEHEEIFKKKEFTDKEVGLLYNFFITYKMDIIYTNDLFKKQIDNDNLICDSDLFKFQYYYICKLYKEMENYDIAIITHG